MLLLVCILSASLAGVGCREPEGAPTAMERPLQNPNEGMRGVALQNFRVGATRWVLHADTAAVFREKRRVEAERVQIEFFEDEKLVSTLTARRGILLQATDDLEARGNVLVRSTEGALLETEVLFWNHQDALIHTDEFVKITKGGSVLTGVGFEADPALEKVVLKKRVEGTVDEGDDILDEEGGT
jgi:LPS export ABC transporter protein LptC